LQNDITNRVQAIITTDDNSSDHELTTASIPNTMLTYLQSLPNVRVMRGGLCHISAILSPTAALARNNEDEAQLAVQEFLSILQTLRHILNQLSPSASSTPNRIKPQNDIFFVHLYLSQISHFAKINQHYQQFFGRHLPPSRSCVGVGPQVLPGERRVMMDCVLQLGSGEYLRADEGGEASEGVSAFVLNALRNKHHALRKTLHVQSISNWAPVCIGPYSQANVLRSSLVFLAGMIGLIPQSMQLITPSASENGSGVKDWQVQLYQSWRNAASVLDGLEDGGSVLGGKLEDCLGGLVYFSLDALNAATKQQDATTDGLPWHALWNTAECICNNAIADNGGIIMGSVDGVAASTALDPTLYDEDGVLYGGYEDEETWREMTGASSSSVPDSQATSDVPLLMVCLSELPMNAQAEVELVCASRRAASCLRVRTGELTTQSNGNGGLQPSVPSDLSMLWDTGYDYPKPSNNNDGRELHSVQITSVSRSVGNGCASVSTVIAHLSASRKDEDTPSLANIDIVDILSKMIDASIRNATTESVAAPLCSIQNVLNVRLYYVAAVTSRNEHDPMIQVNATDDGAMLRTQLHSVLAVKCMNYFHSMAVNGRCDKIDPSSIPAHTVVPVLGMHLSSRLSSAKFDGNVTFLAMQVTLVDTIRMETEMWIRHGREKK
jgi:enamine deaminase RidA (YjgF/YER057c/UK114 family)